MHGSTLPLLALDHGNQVATAISNAFGSGAPQVVTKDPRSQFAGLPLVDANGKPLYSAIIVASDTTCGGCDNNELTSTPDSDAINARAADIAKFFLAGGGILALTGADHRNVYYNFLPVEVLPLHVTPDPGATGNPGVFKFATVPGIAISLGNALGLTNSDINCCITHNSFVPVSGGPLAIVDVDGMGNAITLIGEPSSFLSRNEELGLQQQELNNEGLSQLIDLIFKLPATVCPPSVCSEALKHGLDILGGTLSLLGENFRKLSKDPIDPNFKVIAHPVVPHIPQVTPGPGFTAREAATVNALEKNLVRQIALSNALITSINRVQGAHLVGNQTWEAKQLEATRQYAAQLAELLEAEPELLDNVVDAFEAAKFPTLHITAAEIRKSQNDIAAHGLPASEVGVLRQLGATSTDIKQIQQNLIALNPNTVANLGSGKFPQALADKSVINATLRAAEVLEQFAGSK